MESIRDVLTRMTIPRASSAANTATSSTDVCAVCGGAGWLRLDVPIDDARFGQTVPCACKAAELREKKLRALLEHSNLTALRDKTFASFVPLDERQQRAFDSARAFAERPGGSPERPEVTWFVLLGGAGTGKTHLAAAIGNRRLELGEPAIFIVVPDLLDHLRATFNPSSETPFDELFESVRTAPLLILDDLGTHATTQWANEKMFQLLNHRYVMKLPTVITTNVQLDDLGDRLASRMADDELGVRISLGTIDRRSAREVAPSATPPAAGRPRSAASRRRYGDRPG